MAALLRIAQPGWLIGDTPFELDRGSARLFSLGRTESFATAVWMRTVDQHAPSTDDPAALGRALRLIGDLDPTWVEPWFFGILMLPDSAADERRELLQEAARLHPEVPWFSWRHGMTLLGQDRAAALGWLRAAATTPGADPAYATLLDRLETAP